MKRFFGGSCVGLLLVLLISGATALFTFSVFFNQSQAVTSNTTATTAARATPTQQIAAASITPRLNALLSASDDGAVQITTDDAPTAQPISIPNAAITTPEPLITSFPNATAVPFADSITATSTDAPRHSGTSTYPLTVTAEVMLAQTSVARYQGGVAATRTAIAAESESIFATLTARAPTVAEAKP